MAVESVAEGAAAEAIRAAEAELARQHSAAAQVDLQVVTALLSAHCSHRDGAAALDRLQQDIEAAVLTRPDLGTPAGARALQRFLIDTVRDIRAVVDGAALDATSQASAAAALAALYATADADEAPPPGPLSPEPVPPDFPADGSAAEELFATPSGTPVGTGSMPSLPSMSSLPTLPSLPGSPLPEANPSGGTSLADLFRRAGGHDDLGSGPDSGDEEDASDPGGTPSGELSAVISAAVAGTPIPEAFARQGMTIPAPGGPIDAPLPVREVVAGDVGLFADRHALALGNGNILLDNQIQSIANAGGPDFLGWQHPPQPEGART